MDEVHALMQSKSAPFSDVIAAHLASAEFLRKQGFPLSDDFIALAVYAAFLSRPPDALTPEDIGMLFQVVLKPLKQRLKLLFERALKDSSLEHVFAPGRSPTAVLRDLINIDELSKGRPC